jgi:hypothetical protein
MNFKWYLFFVAMLTAGCSNNKRPHNVYADTVSIHKVWQYDNVKSNTTNPGVIGKHLLDLTKSDTLHFSYQSIKGSATAYAYQIHHDTVFVNKTAAYRILKLTGDELDLYAIFKHGNVKSDSVVLIYKTK